MKLYENSMYDNPTARASIVSNKELCAELFVLNCLGFMGLFALSDSRGFMRTYESSEKRLRVDEIGDENHDVSLIIKLCVDAGVLDAPKVTPLTKLLALIKTKSIKSKDIDEDKLRDIVKTLQVLTKPMNAVVRNALSDWMNGTKTIHQFSFDAYNLAKRPEWRDYTLEFRTLVVKGQYTDFFGAMTRGTWKAPNGVAPAATPKTTATPTSSVSAAQNVPGTTPSAKFTDLVNKIGDAIKMTRPVDEVCRVAVASGVDPQDFLKALATAPAPTKIIATRFTVSDSKAVVRGTPFEKIYDWIFAGVFAKVSPLYFQAGRPGFLVIDEDISKINGGSVSVSIENYIDGFPAPQNAGMAEIFFNMCGWAKDKIRPEHARKFADIAVISNKSPIRIHLAVVYFSGDVRLDPMKLSAEDVKWVKAFGNTAAVGAPGNLAKLIIQDGNVMSSVVWAGLSIIDKLIYVAGALDTPDLPKLDRVLRARSSGGTFVKYGSINPSMLSGSTSLGEAIDKAGYEKIFKALDNTSRLADLTGNWVRTLAVAAILHADKKGVDISPIIKDNSLNILEGIKDNSLKILGGAIINEFVGDPLWAKAWAKLLCKDDINTPDGFDRFRNHLNMSGYTSGRRTVSDTSLSQAVAAISTLHAAVVEMCFKQANGYMGLSVTYAKGEMYIDPSQVAPEIVAWVEKMGEIIHFRIRSDYDSVDDAAFDMAVSCLKKKIATKSLTPTIRDGLANMSVEYFDAKIAPGLETVGLTPSVVYSLTTSAEGVLSIDRIPMDSMGEVVDEFIKTYKVWISVNYFRNVTEAILFSVIGNWGGDRFLNIGFNEITATESDETLGKAAIYAAKANKTPPASIESKVNDIFSKALAAPRIDTQSMIIRGLAANTGYTKPWYTNLLEGANLDNEFNKAVVFALLAGTPACIDAPDTIKKTIDPGLTKIVGRIPRDAIGENHDWNLGWSDIRKVMATRSLPFINEAVMIATGKSNIDDTNVLQSVNVNSATMESLFASNDQLRASVYDQIKRVMEAQPPISIMNCLADGTINNILEMQDFYPVIQSRVNAVIAEYAERYKPSEIASMISRASDVVSDGMDEAALGAVIKRLATSDSQSASEAVVRLGMGAGGKVSDTYIKAVRAAGKERAVVNRMMKVNGGMVALQTINQDPNGVAINVTPARVKTFFKFNDVDIDKLVISNVKKLEDLNNVTSITSAVVPPLPMTELTDPKDIKERTKYLDSNNRYNHNPAFGMIVKRAFKYENKDMKQRFDDWCAAHPNAKFKTLFHGTGDIAGAFILRYGFKIIPSTDASVAGRMFGDGIYLADNLSKAAFYMNNDGYLRRSGVTGYILKCRVALDQLGKDYREGWKESSGRHLVSNEWCVKSTDQIYIEEVYICTSADKTDVNKALNESAGRGESVYLFMDGRIPIDADGNTVDFEAFPNYGQHVIIEKSGLGPVVRIIHDTSIEPTYETYRWGEELGGAMDKEPIKRFLSLLKNTY